MISANTLTPIPLGPNTSDSTPDPAYFVKTNGAGKSIVCEPPGPGPAGIDVYAVDETLSGTAHMILPSTRTIDACPGRDLFLHLDDSSARRLRVLNSDLSTYATFGYNPNRIYSAVFGGGQDFVVTITFPDYSYHPVPVKVYTSQGVLLSSKETNLDSYDLTESFGGGTTRLYRGRSGPGGPKQVFAVNLSYGEIHIINLPEFVTATDPEWALYE